MRFDRFVLRCFKCDTGKNTVISPDFLVWKLCGKAQFPDSFGRFARNYAENVPFRKTSTPGNQVKLPYFSQWRLWKCSSISSILQIFTSYKSWPVYFDFFQRLFFQSHCYLKRTLFRLRNYHEFSRIFLCGELYRIGRFNDLDLTNFQIQTQHKKFPEEHVTY